MTPIICDCDGVLLNWERGFRWWLQDKGIQTDPKGPTSWNTDEWVGQPALPLVRQFNASEKFSTLAAMPQAVTTVRWLSKRGHPLFVLTSCSSEAKVVARRRDNLHRFFGPIFGEIVCLDLGETKAGHLERLHKTHGPCIWVEDHPGHGLDGHLLGHRVFMKRHLHNRSAETEHCPLTWVSDWQEIKSHIMGDAHETLPGIRR